MLTGYSPWVVPITQYGNVIFGGREDCLTNQLALFVRKVDNSTNRVNHYAEDSVVCFINT